MTLHVDDVAKATFARIIFTLRSARETSGLSQNEVASTLGVRGRAISEWECAWIQPKLRNLIPWSGRLDHRLVLLGQDHEPLPGLTRPRPGETWEHFERRRLAYLLKNRRLALGLSQTDLGELVGVSRDSIQRWELARVPPRPMAHVVWAQKLRYTLVVRPADTKLLRPGFSAALTTAASVSASATRNSGSRQ